jgi:hypothetical protein
MFLLVFGIQGRPGLRVGPGRVGADHRWRRGAGAVIAWQTRAPEPLIPMGLFRDPQLPAANVAITTLGLAVTAQAFPITLYAQGCAG